MRLSESLQRGIMKVSPGHIMNTFKVHKRRNIIFFEELFAKYLKKCEDAGYGKEMEELGKEWAAISMENFMPGIMKNVPESIIFTLAKNIWHNIGLVESAEIETDGNRIKITSQNEAITRIIGKNHFMVGIIMGFVCFAHKSDVKLLSTKQNGKSSVYIFEGISSPCERVYAKDKNLYDALNESEKYSKEDDVKKLLKGGIFKLREDNRMYFRDSPLLIVENTIFHLIDNKKILMDQIAPISEEFFYGLISKDSKRMEKIILLKNLLQYMGWGNVKILEQSNRLAIEIKNPPYGMQKEPELHDFICNVILGYLWIIDRKAKIIEKNIERKKITIYYELK